MKQSETSCAGGLCVGMRNGPHEGGNASYPVLWNGANATFVRSTMTVPGLPELIDGITYYVWTDIFFGDVGRGRMNQMVPQLILGSALDGSSGPPDYQPKWGDHETWVFGSHYYFEIESSSDGNKTESHAAYGEMHPAYPGEELFTTFELSPGGDGMDVKSPKWTLTMGVVNDDERVSTLVIDRPYMGLGAEWEGEPSVSWTETNYQNICINACWELYGADDSAHLPSSGAQYFLEIQQPRPQSYCFTSWEQDEGNGVCPSSSIGEKHDEQTQYVSIDIGVELVQSVESSSF